MSNSKEFALPGDSTAFARVDVDPATGGALLDYNPLEVMAGRVNGMAPFAMRGTRTALTVDTELVVQEIATGLVTAAAGVVMTIQSSSAADTAVTLIVTALGADYAFIAPFEVTLTGTTPVALPGGPFTRINSVTRKAGDLVGNCTITNGGTTYGFLAAAQQVMRSATYTVPAGHRLYMQDVVGALSKDAGSNVVVGYSLKSKPVASTGFGSILSWTGSRDGSCSPEISQKYGQPIIGPMDIQVTARASAANADVQAYLSGVLHRV